MYFSVCSLSLFLHYCAFWYYLVLQKLTRTNEDENRSVLKLHANHHHGGADVSFIMKVTGLHNDSLDRQVTEGVNIANFGGDVLMNRRGELGGVRIERQQYRRWGAN